MRCQACTRDLVEEPRRTDTRVKIVEMVHLCWSCWFICNDNRHFILEWIKVCRAAKIAGIHIPVIAYHDQVYCEPETIKSRFVDQVANAESLLNYKFDIFERSTEGRRALRC